MWLGISEEPLKIGGANRVFGVKGLNQPNYYDDRVSIPGVHFHFDRVRIDAVDRRGTNLRQHERCYGQVTAKAQSGFSAGVKHDCLTLTSGNQFREASVNGED